MDSSESPVHGQQEGSAYNGDFESVCYHPLFLFNDHGHCLAARPRSGNVSSADGWEELLVPEIDRQQASGLWVVFRADAAFARPEIYEAVEALSVQYAVRIPANKNLELAIEDLLFRPRGRPSCTPLVRYKSFHYQADSWTTPRRVVAKVGNMRKTCRYFGVARSGFYVWKKAYEAKARAAVRWDFQLTCVPARCTLPRDPKVSASRPEAHVRAQRSEPSGSRLGGSCRARLGGH